MPICKSWFSNRTPLFLQTNLQHEKTSNINGQNLKKFWQIRKYSFRKCFPFFFFFKLEVCEVQIGLLAVYRLPKVTAFANDLLCQICTECRLTHGLAVTEARIREKKKSKHSTNNPSHRFGAFLHYVPCSSVLTSCMFFLGTFKRDLKVPSRQNLTCWGVHPHQTKEEQDPQRKEQHWDHSTAASTEDGEMWTNEKMEQGRVGLKNRRGQRRPSER